MLNFEKVDIMENKVYVRTIEGGSPVKTFKLAGLSLVTDTLQDCKTKDIAFIDGLIINKEDGRNRWLLEVFLGQSNKEIFNSYLESGRDIHLQATISRKNNDPAYLIGQVQSISDMEDNISVLLNCEIANKKMNLAEVILSDLIDQGLDGQALLDQFKDKLSNIK